MKAEYTQGSIPSMMLKTAVAMLASTLAMSGYNIADTFYVGHLGGTAPLAAMGFSFPIVMFAGCLFHGIGGGIMALMAHAIGENDLQKTQRIVFSGCLLLILASLGTMLVGISAANWIYGIMGAEGETLVQLKKYMDIWFYGCFTGAMAMIGNHMMLAAGKPRLTAVMQVAGMLINVILDPIAIFGGEAVSEILLEVTATHATWLLWLIKPITYLIPSFPPMGIAGAAIATVASQAIAALVNIWLLHRVQLLSFHLIPLQELLTAWRSIIRYAIPAMLGMLLQPISSYIVTWITAHFGDTMVAAIAAGTRVEMLAFICPMAFGIPLMSIIAQNYGARLYSRVRYAAIFASSVAFLYLTVASLALMLLGPWIVPLFSPEPAVQKLMITYLRILSWGFGILELTRYAGFVLIGCGHPRSDAVLKAVRICGILLPLSFLTLYLHWQPGIFFSRLTTDVVGGLLCIFAAWRVICKLPADGEADIKA